jgi:hypothetical protein
MPAERGSDGESTLGSFVGKLRVLGGSESIQGGMVFILLNYHHRF